MESHLVNGRQRRYMLAGTAVVTLINTETGKHYTYRIRADDNVHFVDYMVSPQVYQYMGIIKDGRYRWTKRSCCTSDAPMTRAFQWVWDRIDHLPPNVEVWHDGHCSRCGRQLTDPESIERGLGPVCSKKEA